MSESDVDSMWIALDRTNETYKPGELLSGKIMIEVKRPFKTKGIRITVSGLACVFYLDGNTEEYFSKNFCAPGCDSGHVIELPIAQLSYPFTFEIPNDLPSSLEHKGGWIRYRISAVLEGAWKFNFETKTKFSIVTDYNLNQKPQASLPIQEEIHKSFCCCCICRVGEVHVTISVPSSGFVPGQMIPVTVGCENESTVDVSEIKVFLERKVTVYVTSPSLETEEWNDIMAEEKCENPFTTSFEDHVNVQLKVPPLPPSGLEYCGIIDLNYSLGVIIRFSGMHRRLKRTFPILIGTIPLGSSADSCNRNATVPLASAPLLEEPRSPIRPFQDMPETSGMPQPGVPSHLPPQNPAYQGIWDSNNYLAPPSYDQTMGLHGASEYDQGPGTSFARRYPVHNYGSVSTVPNPNAPPYEKQ